AQLGHHRSDLSFAEPEPTQARKDLGLHLDRARLPWLTIGVAIGVQDAQPRSPKWGQAKSSRADDLLCRVQVLMGCLPPARCVPLSSARARSNASLVHRSGVLE